MPAFARAFSTTSSFRSGHNRWSKIKHDKGAADVKKNRFRTTISKELALTSKIYGPDPNMNPRLASLLIKAKKAGVPKSSIESAIARGQGKSTMGATLESVTLEAIMPPSIALIIDAETENRARILMDLRYLVKRHGGVVAPTGYLFRRKGRLIFEKDERNLTVDEVLEEAIEAGAEDVEAEEDGSVVVWTEPSNTIATAESLLKSLGLRVENSDIIWDANKDTIFPMNDVDPSTTRHLIDLVEALQENPDVQGVFANVEQGNLSDERWQELQSHLDA